jgi:LL-diaminopimelate aminotransferase
MFLKPLENMTHMAPVLANRIRQLPPYLFAHIDQLKAQARARGSDLIDLGIGDPDLPTPAHVIAALQQAAALPKHHRYPSYEGMQEFRAAAARFMARRFGVTVDAAKQVMALIGSKEGIAHFPMAFVDPGDVVLVPDPGYPVYATASRWAGGEVVYMPLRRERGFLPDLGAVPTDVARRAKMMWLNYPNNPTAALAPASFYREVVEFARGHSIIVASDMAYSEIFLDGNPPASFLETPGALELGIEFHSLSKTFNMTGWRIAFAAGAQELVAGLGKVKTNVDSGTFEAVQAAAIAGLDGDWGWVEELRATYRRRRDVLVDGLRDAGFDVLKPEATFYMLVACPPGYTAVELASKLLTDAGVVATPATGFGQGGEGFVRLTVCAPEARLREAVARIKQLTL